MSVLDITKMEGWTGGINPNGMYTNMISNYNKISEEDLKELKNSQKQKIVITKPFLNYKIGDVLEVKFFRNSHESEPPTFLVIDEKLGSAKYGVGGRGSTPFYETYKEKVQRQNLYAEDKFWRSLGFTQSGMIPPKGKGRFFLIIGLVAGYFAYKKFKK